MEEEINKLIKQAEQLLEKKQYGDVIALLKDEILEKYKSSTLYRLRAMAHRIIHSVRGRGLTTDTKLKFKYINKAIRSDRKNPICYLERGNAWFNIRNFKKAIIDYTKALELKPDNSFAAGIHNNLGMVYYRLSDYDKAIEEHSISIDLRPKNPSAYSNRGSAFYLKGNYEKAIDDYTKAISIDKSKYNYLLADIDTLKEKLKTAKELEKANKTERDNKIQSFLNEIDNSIKSIQKIAQWDKETPVVHYTKLSVAEKIITYHKSKSEKIITNDDCKMRFYNVIYMNDPEEGNDILNYFKDKRIKECYESGRELKETNVYIGSFLPAKSHQDELLMWLTYGRDENKMEAAGCSLVLASSFFNKSTKNQYEYEFVIDSQTSGDHKITEQLMSVIYIDKIKRTFSNQGINKELKPVLNELEEQLGGLIKIRDGFRNKNNKKLSEGIDKAIFERLSEISHLFKSSDYSFENEVRVILYVPPDSVLIKSSNDNMSGYPRKLYVESSNEILPHLKKIYLGPKVQNPNHWSAYLDYEIRQRAKEKLEKENINVEYKVEISKSSCNFQ